MKIVLVFVYASGEEQCLVAESCRLLRSEGKIIYTHAGGTTSYELMPGDRVDVCAAGYTSIMKRNKV